MPDDVSLRDALGPAFARRVYESRYAPLAADYDAIAQDLADRPTTDRGPSRGDDADARAKALAAVRAAAGPDFGPGVCEIVQAHLLEIWGMGLAGDAARVGRLLR